jgi:hypothetical protein
MSLQAVSSDAPVPAFRRTRARTLTDIRACIDGPPLSVGELAYALGLSREKIRCDILQGHIAASFSGMGTRTWYRIEIREAQRYLRALGF